MINRLVLLRILMVVMLCVTSCVVPQLARAQFTTTISGAEPSAAVLRLSRRRPWQR